MLGQLDQQEKITKLTQRMLNTFSNPFQPLANQTLDFKKYETEEFIPGSPIESSSPDYKQQLKDMFDTVPGPAIPEKILQDHVLKNTTRFTPQEDEIVEKGVAMLGLDWIGIIKWAQNSIDRTPLQIKNRYKRILQKRKLEISNTPLKSPELDDSDVIDTAHHKVTPAHKRKRIDDYFSKITISDKKPLHTLSENTENNLLDTRREYENKLDLVVFNAEKRVEDVRQESLKTLEKSQKIIISLLDQHYLNKFLDTQTHLNSESQRLANVVYERSGLEWSERWSEGSAFKKIKEKTNQIHLEREELIEKRKLLKKTLIDVNDEAIKIRLAHLKKDEQELEKQVEKLIQERNIHVFYFNLDPKGTLT